MSRNIAGLLLFVGFTALVGCAGSPATQPSAGPISTAITSKATDASPAASCGPSQTGRYQAIYSPTAGFYMLDTQTGQLWHRDLNGWVMDGSPVTRTSE